MVELETDIISEAVAYYNVDSFLRTRSVELNDPLCLLVAAPAQAIANERRVVYKGSPRDFQRQVVLSDWLLNDPGQGENDIAFARGVLAEWVTKDLLALGLPDDQTIVRLNPLQVGAVGTLRDTDIVLGRRIDSKGTVDPILRLDVTIARNRSLIQKKRKRLAAEVGRTQIPIVILETARVECLLSDTTTCDFPEYLDRVVKPLIRQGQYPAFFETQSELTAKIVENTKVVLQRDLSRVLRRLKSRRTTLPDVWKRLTVSQEIISR